MHPPPESAIHRVRDYFLFEDGVMRRKIVDRKTRIAEWEHVGLVEDYDFNTMPATIGREMREAWRAWQQWGDA